jgi:hypothetical protein
LQWKCAKGHEWSATLNNIKNINTWCPYCVGNIRKTAKIIAFNKVGYCISSKYINSKSCLRLKCARDHEWNATLKNVKNQDTWYPYCAGQTKNTLDIAKIIAINKSRECISNKWFILFAMELCQRS